MTGEAGFDPHGLERRIFEALWRRNDKKAADDWYEEVADAFRTTPTKARTDMILLLHDVLSDDPKVRNPTKRVAALFAPGGELAAEHGTVTEAAVKKLLNRHRKKSGG